MSANEPKPPIDEETVLQWLLDADLRAEVSRSELETSHAAELADLEGFLAECRAELREADAALESDARRLADAVLARTVREDLGWRGDLRLVRNFVSNRMRSSLILRFAAASLLVHLIALPVIAAYRAWQADKHEAILWIDFEPQHEQPFIDEPSEELVQVHPAESPTIDSLDALSANTANARNADRWSLFERGEELRALADGEWNHNLERRLAARARRLIGDGPFEYRAAASDDPLDRLLALDEALDARLFGLAIPIDNRSLAWLATQAAGDPPRAAVALAVLRRAQRYGVALPKGSQVLLERLAAPEFEFFADLTTPGGEAPLSVEWIRALRASADASAISQAFEDTLQR